MPRPYYNINDKDIEEIIRVNHAGEFGAQRIYLGQLDFIKDPKQKKIIKHMCSQEKEHLDYFIDKMITFEVRPTILTPAWYFGGYLLGAISAICGPKTAMLVTDQVEDAIVQHYQGQIDLLSVAENTETYHDLKESIEKFQKDELEHQQIAIANDSRLAPSRYFIKKVVEGICSLAIMLSKKI